VLCTWVFLVFNHFNGLYGLKFDDPDHHQLIKNKFPMVILDLKKEYTRRNDILYCEGIPIIRFTVDKFPDIHFDREPCKPLTESSVKYMQRYITMFKNKIEVMSEDKRIKKFFYDVETTGTNFRRCSIHQLSAWVEIDGEVVEKLNLHMKPHPNALIEDGALAVSGTTLEQIQAYPEFAVQMDVLLKMLKKYVDPYSKNGKMFMIGFKNASFDDDFLKKAFDLHKSKFFFYFYASSIDVSCLAAQYLMNIRGSMPSFKLSRVAKTVGIEVDDDKLHDADYDVFLTREVYYTVSKVEENLF
jgi:DNA polymerase-3 subunit epsilon